MKLLSFQRHYYSSFANSSLKFGTILSELVKKKISIGNVLDIGSGTCELVYGFSKNDLDFVAIDKHDEKISEKYLGNNNFFFKLDITKKIDLKKKFDCCICIEVLEHVENSNSDNVIQNLIRHSDFIIFSSAQNGQGGLNHINEQPLDYWINKFKKYDFICFDYIRPQILLKKIPFFYKSNTLIFINKKNSSLINKFLDYQISKNTYSDSFLFKLRKFILKSLNYKLINYLVLINYLIKNLINKFILTK